MKKNGLLVGMLGMALVFGMMVTGCDTGGGGGGGGSLPVTGGGSLSVTIENQYANPITAVGFSTENCTIDGLTVTETETEGPDVTRQYDDYTTPIAPGSSKTFSVTPDANETQKMVSVVIHADGINWWESVVAGVFGDSYNQHFTVILYPDGEVDGDFEK